MALVFAATMVMAAPVTTTTMAPVKPMKVSKKALKGHKMAKKTANPMKKAPVAPAAQ
jgi:hypothetical protein